MFEGFVRKLLLGYLGHYCRDIQLDKLNFRLQEVVLNDVEFNLEAFDFLQLPFSLKQGKIGKLIIRNLWKLGWEPIVITLEDVLISACQWDDQEWNGDAIERREMAAKKSKLASAELAKLTKPVCDSQAGKSFKSYLTAKILESIQVSMKNVNFLYRDRQCHLTLLGLRFSSLTILKQNPVGSSSNTQGSGQVHKIVEILGLEIYCGTSRGSQPKSDINCSVLEPVDISVSLMVNKSGMLKNDAPQCSISAESSGLVLSLDEVQLQQVFMLCDNICICRLREKYGRYRPWANCLSKKFKGWQIAWWHYAQKSVLSDVRRKLKRSSWRYFTERMTCCRKYVKLYRAKLECLWRNQPINEYILQELEEMEKVSDIEDILLYRSTAEYEIQELSSHSSITSLGMPETDVGEKVQSDDHSSSWSRGWFHWISHGMLGASGTEDSSQFSDDVFDDVVRNIREETEFDPGSSTGNNASLNNNYFITAIKFSTGQITTTLRSMKLNQGIAEFTFRGLVTDCKLWQNFASITTLVNFFEIAYPHNKSAIVYPRQVFNGAEVEDKKPSIHLKIDVSPLSEDMEFVVKAVLEAVEVNLDLGFVSKFFAVYSLLESFVFHHERVLQSLNGIGDAKARLLSKAECIFTSRKKVTWDIRFLNAIIKLPWTSVNLEQYEMILEFRSLFIESKQEIGSLSSILEDEFHSNSFLSSVWTNDSLSFMLHDLYVHFEANLNDCEIKLVMPQFPKAKRVLGNFGLHMTFASCIIPDESILQQFLVYVSVSSLQACLSPTICGAVLGLISYIEFWLSKLELSISSTVDMLTLTSRSLSFSLTAHLDSVFCCLDLMNDGEKKTEIICSLQGIDVRYVASCLKECWVRLKVLEIFTKSLSGEESGHTLCSTGNVSAANLHHDMVVRNNTKSDYPWIQDSSADGCFLLQYESCNTFDCVSHKCIVFLNNIDLHCYPFVIGLVTGFCDRIPECGVSHCDEDYIAPIRDSKCSLKIPHFAFQRFGFSNYCEPGSSESATIPVDQFPFLTIFNSGHLTLLENSLIHDIPEWKNYFRLTERKHRSPKISFPRKSKIFHSSPLQCTTDTSQCSDGTDVFSVDFNISGVRIQFHDSSCIFATLALPVVRSSLSANKNCWDMLCSAERVTLSSSWWSQKLQEYLWGPLSPSISPVLNVRVKKGGESCPKVEVSFGIQHVSCILPPELLAIIIGYFSLPDWSYDEKNQPMAENNANMDMIKKSSIVYKLEVLDSALVVPVKCSDNQFLKLGIQQLYFSFFESEIILKDIPPECRVPEPEISESDCCNMFGRQLSLSLLLLSDCRNGVQILDQKYNVHKEIAIIAPLSADMWVRIPCEGEFSLISSQAPAPTYFMARIQNCQLSIEDQYICSGSEAFLDTLSKFFSIDEDSKSFKNDIFQFLYSTKGSEGTYPTSSHVPAINFTDIKCCVDSLSIKFGCMNSEQTLVEPVFQTDIQFTCAASLKNETLSRLDASFFSLAVFSCPRSRMLAECISVCSEGEVLSVHFSKLDYAVNELKIDLPSLNIWLHFPDLVEFIELMNCYFGHYGKTTSTQLQSKDGMDLSENEMTTLKEDGSRATRVSSYVAQGRLQQHTILNMKLENVGITFYVPIFVEKIHSNMFEKADIQHQTLVNVSPITVQRENSRCFTITLQNRCTELVFSDSSLKCFSNVGKITGAVVLDEGKTTQSWPFFQLFQLQVEVEMYFHQLEPVSIQGVLQSDSLDVWLSHQVLFFWHVASFEQPEAGDSKAEFGKIELEAQIKKVSLLLTDGRGGSSGPLLELLLRNLVVNGIITPTKTKGTVCGEIQLNYNNIHKVLWEPFLEPWDFELSMVREHGKSALLNDDVMTDIALESKAQFNLNLTESVLEAVFRATEMIKDASDFMGLKDFPEIQSFLKNQDSENEYNGKYAPYVLQNLTSLPLVFHVCEGLVETGNLSVSSLDNGTLLQPGSSSPIFINESPEEQFFRFKPAHSSDRLNERQSNWVAHHYISVQLNGTSMPSNPISMDLVGLTYVEVDFSNVSNKAEAKRLDNMSKHDKIIEEIVDVESSYIVPVVVDVSVHRYSKLVRLYSTVILFNATSVPFELRFDIPFGLAPKILDPIYPGQDFPLPLHLAEAGRMRWRPLGSNHLWSEAHNLPSILLQENKFGYMRSFVCYPSYPTCDPFRCCMSVQSSVLSSGTPRKGSSYNSSDSLELLMEGKKYHNLDPAKKRCIHYLTLSAPFVVKNFLPEAVSLKIESGGITRTSQLTEVETSFFHVDSSHDLAMEFQLKGFKTATLTFPRSEIFSAVANFSETKFYITETMVLDPDLAPSGPLHVLFDKAMDVQSGARELCIYVPFLLYNCAGFPLTLLDSTSDMRDKIYTIPSYYDLCEQELGCQKDGLSLLSSDDYSRVVPSRHNLKNLHSKEHILSSRKIVDSHLEKSQIKHSNLSQGWSQKYDFDMKDVSGILAGRVNSNIRSNPEVYEASVGGAVKVKPYMYSPFSNSSSSEVMVRIRRYLPECSEENTPNSCWSNCFSLVPPAGSTNVLVPQLSKNAAYSISVTSSSVAGQLLGRTKAITFQPRFVISNTCCKNICYKQKGTDTVFQLGISKHSNLHWIDTTRELLITVCFSEPGWEWSGCFMPENLGDTQVKVRNYDTGIVSMLRIEVQNADVSTKDAKILGSTQGNYGTTLILLSDDDTGFMPYRIDNFSKEKLRIYQQNCETFATTVHPYTSFPYAWDEPCYPHRLTVEVPGERVLGSYSLDDVREYKSINLSSTSEKPERTVLVSLRAEGAMKVLSIIDSSYHLLKDVKDQAAPWFQDKRKIDQTWEYSYKDKISISIPFIGISLINFQKELIFACAKNTTIDFLQNFDQQKLSFQISSLQIDNQLHSTPYPVILSFDHGVKVKDDVWKNRSETTKQMVSDGHCLPVFYFSAVKWRNKDVSYVSFQHISFRVADFHLELDQEILFSLLDFSRTVLSSSRGYVLPFSTSTLPATIGNAVPLKEFSIYSQDSNDLKVNHCSPYSVHNTALIDQDKHSFSLPSVVPIGAPWQRIYLLARRQEKIYVEDLNLAPIKLTLSFSSSPWLLRNGNLTSGDSLLQRGLMALADVEGAKIHLKTLKIAHHMASWNSIQQIIIRHYSRQTLHGMYKVFGSAGVIGNPMGFARSLGLGLKDFLSVPARTILRSPTGLISGMAQGTTSLLSNTVYAVTDATTQFSRAAHKGIVALTFDDQDVAKREAQQINVATQSKGVINEFLEGLTGLLQSPVRGAEKHGLPGIFSGIALGVTGLVARPTASILEVTGKTAQSIRNRSKLHQIRSQRFRVRLPRPLSTGLPLRPYSWEEAVAASVLTEFEDGLRFKDEILIVCKELKQGGKYILVTERLLIVVSCLSLVGMGTAEFKGVPSQPEWVIEVEIELENVIHADANGGVLHIVGSYSDTLLKHSQLQQKSRTRISPSTQMPLFQTNLEVTCKDDADKLLHILLSSIGQRKDRGRGSSFLHRRILK